MPKIEIDSVPEIKGSRYPRPYNEPCMNRVRKALGDAGGLTQFGVNLLTLPPGAWSSQRHWHEGEDEFVWVLSGEVVLISNEGEEILKAGDCATFAKGEKNGHHLVNRGKAPATVLEVGTRTPEDSDMCYYPDADLVWNGPLGTYTQRDGVPYPKRGE